MAPRNDDSWDDDLTPPGGVHSVPHPSEVPERLYALEATMRAVVSSIRNRARQDSDTKRWIRNLVIAIGVAMLGAMGTTIAAGMAAAVAYGELRQQAEVNGDGVRRLESEIRTLRTEIRSTR